MNVEGISLEKIIVLYRQGKSYKFICDYFNIDSIKKTKERIHEYINEKGLYDIYTERFNNIDPKELYDLRQRKLTNTQIGNLYDLTSRQVSRKIIVYTGKNNLEEPFSYSNKLELNIDDIVNDFLNGSNYKELANKYNTSLSTIKKRLLTRYTEDELYKFRNKAFNEKLNKTEDIVKLYEAGIKVNYIADYYEVSEFIINNILCLYYKVQTPSLPRLIPEKTLLESIHNKKLTPEELQKNAKEANRIIPTYLINNLKGFSLNLNDIRNFVEEKVLSNKNDEVFTKQRLEDIDFAQKLKDKKYDLKHQVSALLYNLSKSRYSNISEIVDIVGRR